MRTRLLLASPLALTLLAACEEPLQPPTTPTTPPPPTAQSSAPSPAVSASVAQAPAAPPPKLDQIPRLEWNRIAAQLDLPLFWIDDTKNPGFIDPDETATLWGISDKPAAYTEGGSFTPAFYEAYRAMLKIKAEGYPLSGLPEAEKKRRSAILAELAGGRTALVHSDFRKSSEEDRAVVDHVVKAAAIIERIFAKQTGSFGMEAQIPADDPASKMAFYRNQGPWCQAPKTENDPNCNALPQKPAKISGLYPASVQKDPKFCETLQARPDQKTLLDTFSAVTEQGGDLKPVPYNIVYKDEMEAISRELSAAADAVKSADEAPFKAYLAAAAQSFKDNNWVPSDEAWAKMNVNNSKWYLRIAPDEVYFEPCSLHAGFHVSFARINQDSVMWQKKLEPVKTEMEAVLAKMAGAPYKARNVTFHLPDFIDIVLNAGDSRSALGATIGQSLPNVGPVANEGRGRTVAMTNLYTDKDSENSYKEQTASIFCKATADLMPFDPPLLTMSTVLHEAAHNLGPAHEYKVKGKPDREVFGGPLASTLEELKAQTSAMFFADWLADKKLLDKKQASMSHARDMAWAFGHIAEGMYTADKNPKPYAQLASIQAGTFVKAGAMVWKADEMAPNGKDKGCFEINPAKMSRAVAELEKTVLGIKGRGDKASAQKLVAEFVDREGDWSKLRAVITERWLRAPRASFVYAVDR
ncbi:MAG: hypothetical protein U0359_28725 [Byssovorax sp.]